MELIRRRPIFVFILACLLMALIYTQLPLYASNQHQYFLHGMAQAGLGSLDEDWLSTTREPTPLFTLLVKTTFQVLKDPFWFYVFYALLMGLYLWSILGILDLTLDIGRSATKMLFTAALILAAHSAALRFLLGSRLGPDWTFLFDGGLAGQRLLGTVLQPSVFGVFLLAAILLFLRGRPVRASALAALAACIHPTYLFTAGLLVTGFMLAGYLEERDFWPPLRMGTAALAVVAPILIFTLVHFTGGEDAAYAHSILIDIRLPHHTLSSEWLDLAAAFKMLIVAGALLAVKDQRNLFIPLCVVFCGSFLLTAYQILSGSPFLALLFPWRPSALLVPLASSVLIGKLALFLLDRARAGGKVSDRLISVLCVLLLLALCAAGLYRMSAAASDEHLSPQRGMLEWVRAQSTDEDRFLIPVNIEKFRTTTLRPVYVDFFAIPYKSADVVTWYHRVLAANKFYDTRDCMELYHVAYDGDLNHVVMERSAQQPDCPGLEQRYQDDHYVVYRYTRK